MVNLTVPPRLMPLVKPLLGAVAIGLLTGIVVWRYPLSATADADRLDSGTVMTNRDLLPGTLAWAQTPLRLSLDHSAAGGDLAAGSTTPNPPEPDPFPSVPEFEPIDPVYQVELVGVATGGVGGAVGFFRDPGGRVAVLGLGEDIAGATIESITSNRAVLRHGEEAVVVRLPEPTLAEPSGGSTEGLSPPPGTEGFGE